ncbi:nectin cell adhesion molecule 1b isoform X1 [Dunckerocampus dactyliophorus]|uniref:nectin cell adhesion molecule 1b isoform X1 n=1 Tax=Dunckerocampus dactyliophorus TaxID=161453 RepID=UPI00240549CF|nr:nectin cell adhesion molecule 1b isoform X1 [Dunckerocampus dactyliophorus]
MAQLCAGIYVLLLALHVQDGSAQMVQMDSSKSGFVGSQVELRCIFINSSPPVKISQVTWQKLLNGTKQNVAIANPALGVSVLSPFKERVSFKQAAVRHRTPSLEDTTIVFSNLQLHDEAAYICEYTTFPAGNRENMVNLTVFARPMTRMTLTTPTIVARAQRRKMTVATCVSANGKPPSVIKWDTRLKGEATFQETRNQNGTVTVRSNYVIVPGRETHKQKLTCIVTYRNERFADSVVLNVQYEPEVKIEGFDGNWYLNRQNVQLTCRADANPPVTIYQWKLLNGSLPSNVEIRNNSLFFKGAVTYDLAGTYVCDATNGIGTRTGIVDVNITEKPMARGPPGGVIGILGGIVAIGLIIGVAVTVVMVHRRQQKTRTETDNDLIAVAAVADSCVTQAAEKPESATRTDLPPAHKPAPPPPKKKNSDMKGHLTSDDIQVVHLDKDEEMQKLPLQPPYYDMAPSESTPFTDKPDSGKHPEEPLNPAEYMSHQRDMEHLAESQPAQAHPPVTFLPQHAYAQPPSNEPMYSNTGFSAPGSRPPFPKEQSV